VNDSDTVLGGGTHWAQLHIKPDDKTATLYNSAYDSREVVTSAQDVLDRIKLLLNINGIVLTEAKDFPQQKNGFDCGLYTMMAADAIINKKAFYHPNTLRQEVSAILIKLISNRNR
jgi:Ulp1 family protease